MKSAFNRSILALAAILVVAGAGQAGAQQKALKKYESGTKDFWNNPPPDWFLGDETEAQKGQAPPSGPPTGASDAELAAAKAKLLNGSPMSGLWPQASTEPLARQQEENNWAVILHLSQFLGYLVVIVGFVAPILIWMLMKNQYPGLDAHGKNVMNWILSSLIYVMIGFLTALLGIGIIVLIALGVVGIVFPIVGAVKASQGIAWKYPLTIEFLK